jgi:fructose-1,6-bisphosphatase I
MAHRGTDLIRFILEEERNYPNASGSLTLALTAIETVAKIISSRVKMAGLADVLAKAGRSSDQGQEVQKLEVFANELMIRHLADSGQFFAIASEEVDDPFFPEEGKEGKYVIAFDPLDGSTNINININIGTIFSIHKKDDGSLADLFQEGFKQVAAGYIIYGSSTMMVYSTGFGVNGFIFDPACGLFLLSHPDMKIPERGSMYSVNEGHYPRWDSGMKKYIDSLKEKDYSSRYVGTMVADIHRTLIRGGVFAYPADEKNKNGKLRLLYEAAPMAFLMHQAGGKATTGKKDILRIKPESVHQTVPVFMGSPADIDDLMTFILDSAGE